MSVSIDMDPAEFTIDVCHLMLAQEKYRQGRKAWNLLKIANAPAFADAVFTRIFRQAKMNADGPVVLNCSEDDWKEWISGMIQDRGPWEAAIESNDTSAYALACRELNKGVTAFLGFVPQELMPDGNETDKP